MFIKILLTTKKAIMVVIAMVLFCSGIIYGEPIDTTSRDLEVTTETLESGLEATIVAPMHAAWYDDVSMVVDDKNNPHIIYKNNELKLEIADFNNGRWTATTLSPSSSGGWNSIVEDKEGYFHISSSTSCGMDEDLLYFTNKGGWQYYLVKRWLSVGLDNDIALDSQGNVHISHWQWGGRKLLYSTNKNGVWDTNNLDSLDLDATCWQTSITIDANDNMSILYRGNRLVFLDSTTKEKNFEELPTGVLPSRMIIDNEDNLHIVGYKGVPSTKNDYVYLTSKDDWILHDLPKSDGFMNELYMAGKSSIAVDSDGKVHIAVIGSPEYIYHLGDNGEALYYLTYQPGEWREFLIDRSFGCHNPSLVIDRENNIHIAYSEDDSYRHSSGYFTNRTVKYVTFNPSELNLPHNLMTGLCYGPYREGKDPTLGIHPSIEEIDKDLLFIGGLTPYVRTFGIDSNLVNIPKLCYSKGINCFAGVWLSDSNSVNEQAIENALDLAREENYSLIGIVVGNEAVYSGSLAASEVAGYINELKQKIEDNEDDIFPRPEYITTAEPWSIWFSNPELAEAADIIMANVYPYWEGIGIENAAAYVVQIYEQLDATFDKQIVISETGWPTQGATIGEAVPSQENQTRFLLEFMALAEENNIPYFWFEAFDEPWKANFEGEAGAHWGLVDVNGVIKDSLASIIPLSESESSDLQEVE